MDQMDQMDQRDQQYQIDLYKRKVPWRGPIIEKKIIHIYEVKQDFH
jgi:hypothetical protein